MRETKERLNEESATYQQESSQNANMRQVLDLDEQIVTRYQKSIDSCRESTRNIIDGNLQAALLYAKDVGETEEDIEPLIRERQKLLHGNNAGLL